MTARGLRVAIGITALVCVGLTAVARAADTNGVSPQAISLPSGPGSIEGLGESFEPQLNTGMATYGVGFSLPPGRTGHQPRVGLRYDGGGGNGIAGMGWSLAGVGYIQRQSDKGLPRYDRTDTFVTAAGEELVRLSDGSYRTENEGGFLRFHFDDLAQVWTAETPDGGLLTFGADATARVEDGGRVFRWMLTRNEDSNGNRIDYAYTSLPGSTNQVFCDRIYYTRHASYTLAGEHVVVFSYAGGRPDPISDYRAGFEVTTDHRLVGVDICTRGGSFSPESVCDDVGEVGAARVRAYRLRYDEAGSCTSSTCDRGLVGGLCTADEQCVAGATRLAGVLQLGADGVSSLPELTFSYTDYDFSTNPVWTLLSGFPEDLIAGDDASFVDLNADGFPDILSTPSPGTYELRENVGPILNGIIRFEAPQTISGPSGQQLSLPGTQLADFNGDGFADLVTRPVTGNDDFRIYPGTGRGFFSLSFELFKILGFDSFVGSEGFASADLRLVDLDFDKRIDVVKTVEGPTGLAEDLLIRRTATLAGQQTMLATQACGPVSGALFQGGKTFLVDMNGDRLLDLVVVALTPGQDGIQRIDYYPAVGSGGFGTQGACGAQGQAITLAGDAVDPSGADYASFREFRWQDVTNDGLGDLLWLGPSSLKAWINRGGNVLEEVSLGPYPSGITLELCDVSPSCPTPDVVEIVDVNANGTADVVLVDRSGSPTARFLDFAGATGVPAHLLRKIDNGLGSVTTIDYESSSSDYVEARNNGTPWKSRLPFPVTVVSAKRLRFGLDLDGTPGEDEYRTEFRYRDGYYDGLEREFRGFSEVEVIARGDASQPTLVTRHSFHTGAPDGVDNDGDGSIDERSEDGGREEEPLKGVPLEVRQETCSDGPDGDCLVTGETFTHDYSRWEVRTLYGATGKSCSLAPELACCSDSECSAAGLGSCQVAQSPEADLLPEDACSLGQSVHWAARTGARRAVVERDIGPRVDVVSESDFDEYGNRTLARDWGVVSAPDLPPFGCLLTSGVCSGNAQILCGTDADCGVQGPCSRSSHADASVCSGDPFAFANPTSPVDEAFATMTWVLNTSDWQLRCEQDSTIEDGSGNVEAHGRQLFDGLSLGQCVAGNLTRREAELIQEGRFIARARILYDDFGNAVETQDARDNRRTFGFDDRFETYVTDETIHLDGYSIAMYATYHEGFGVVDSNTAWDLAAAGPLYEYRYDGFGRLVSEVLPGDSIAAPTRAYEYHLNEASDGLSSIVTRQREIAGGGTVDLHLHVDGLGRSLGAKQEGELASEWIQTGAMAYNHRGAASSSWLPKATSDFAYQLPDASDPHYLTRYDALGRIIEYENPDGSLKRQVHRPLVVDAYDERDTAGLTPGAFQSHGRDGLGRLATVVERTDGDSLDTLYEYDARGNLVRSTDDHGNIVESEYDSLSRRTRLDDPDRGRSLFAFDDADNLIDTTDAKGQRVVFAYDRANRLTSENYLDDTGDPLTDPVDVSYFYDLPAPGGVALGDGTTEQASFTAGELSYIVDLSGEEHRSYDERHRRSWTAKLVRDPVLGVLVPFTNRMGYDSLDRLVSLEYPDGDRITQQYSPRGLLRAIRGANGGRAILDDASYAPSGLLSEQVYGNGVVTSFEYDDRLRLSRIRTLGAGATAGSELLDYRYLRDPTSNVEVVEDLRDGVVGGNPRHNTQRLGYDDLHRLTSYRLGSAQDPGASYGDISYTYDNIGNLLTQSSDITHSENGKSLTEIGTMSYGGVAGRFGRGVRNAGDPPGPHALTATDSGLDQRSYLYDANGNVTSVDGVTAAWDFKDRLVAVETDDFRADYSYDYSGRRITKKVTAKHDWAGLVGGEARTALYPSSHFELREARQPTKFVFFGRGRAAEVTGSLDPTASRIQRVWLRSGWNLVSVAVDAQDTAARLDIGGATVGYRVEPSSGALQLLDSGSAIPAGSLVWLLATSPAVLSLVGSYAGAPDPAGAGPGFVGLAALESLATSTLLSSENLWSWDAGLTRWRSRLGPPLSALSDGPGVLGPGAALYRASRSSQALELPPASARIRFHHLDHLGSSTVLTDEVGNLVEESSYYPYGATRIQTKMATQGLNSAGYGFQGKERDRESGLQYFETRFYLGTLPVFLSVDPLRSSPTPTSQPRTANAYAMALGNPYRYVDPAGRSPEDLDEGDGTDFDEQYDAQYGQDRDEDVAEEVLSTFLAITDDAFELAREQGRQAKELIETGIESGALDDMARFGGRAVHWASEGLKLGGIAFDAYSMSKSMNQTYEGIVEGDELKIAQGGAESASTLISIAVAAGAGTGAGMLVSMTYLTGKWGADYAVESRLENTDTIRFMNNYPDSFRKPYDEFSQTVNRTDNGAASPGRRAAMEPPIQPTVQNTAPTPTIEPLQLNSGCAVLYCNQRR